MAQTPGCCLGPSLARRPPAPSLARPTTPGRLRAPLSCLPAFPKPQRGLPSALCRWELGQCSRRWELRSLAERKGPWPSTVSGAAQVPGHGRGASDHSGPCPRRCQQPLSHRTDLQCPAGQTPRHLPAALPQPSAELPVLCFRRRPGGRLLPAGCTAPGGRPGPGPGPAAWLRDPGRQGCGVPRPASWHGRFRRGLLRR